MRRKHELKEVTMSTDEERELQTRHISAVITETAIFPMVMILHCLEIFSSANAAYRNPRLRCPSNYYIISLTGSH